MVISMAGVPSRVGTVVQYALVRLVLARLSGCEPGDAPTGGAIPIPLHAAHAAAVRRHAAARSEALGWRGGMPIPRSVAMATVLADVMGTRPREQPGQHAALTLVLAVAPSRRTAPTPGNR